MKAGAVEKAVLRKAGLEIGDKFTIAVIAATLNYAPREQHPHFSGLYTKTDAVLSPSVCPVS